jgi:WD40 repeat protein
MPPSDFGRAYQPLDKVTALALSEIVTLKSPDSLGHVSKIGFLASDNIFVAVYAEQGVVMGRYANTSDIAFKHSLGIVSDKGLAFVASDKYLVGATERIFKPDISKRAVEYVNGIALWDVRTGELQKCISYPCQGNKSGRDGYLGITVAPDGMWEAVYSEGVISLDGLLVDSEGPIHTINPQDASYHWDIGNVAFDSKHRRYAVVFQEGRIYLSGKEFSVDYHVLADGVEGHRLPVADAQFDPTGQRLVVVRGNYTNVWDIDTSQTLFDINTSSPTIAFDKDGKLLFIGDNDKLTIYDLEAKNQLAEYEVPGITSLSISEDNRLVIIGDDLGQIRVWGKTLP